MAYIERQLQAVIEQRMFRGKAIVLIGARQVGKSTLFKQILASREMSVFFGIYSPAFKRYASPYPWVTTFSA